MPTHMNNPPLNKAYPPPAAGTRVSSMNAPRNRNSTAIDSHHAPVPKASGGGESSPGKNSSPRPRRKRRCQSCLPTPRRSNTSTNNPSSSRDNVPRIRPQGTAPGGGSIRAKDLVISNPIPIDDGTTNVPRGRRPGNLVPIVPFKEINRDFSSPDPSDLSSDRSRTASEARTPMSELSLTSDTDITSVEGTSGDEEEGQSTLSYGATTTTTGYDSGYTSSSTGGYSSSSLGTGRIPGKQMTANMHIHRLSMNMDSRLNGMTGDSHLAGSSVGAKHRHRAAPPGLETNSTSENPGGRQAIRMSTQSNDIPLHMAHPGNRQSAIVQFSDPSYAHHVASLQRSMSTAEKRRSIRLIPKDPYDDDTSSPSSTLTVSETTTAAHSSRHSGMNNVPGRHSVYGVPPPAPSPPMSSDGYTEKSTTTAGTPAPPPTGVTSNADADDLTSTAAGAGVNRSVSEKKSIGQVARTVLLLPPLVTVLVVDKAWRKVRGKKGPRPMGEVPGVWKVLGLAPS